jgi:glutamate-ammonia-ligase adenylyltransferase
MSLPDTFVSVRFREPARVAANLGALRGRLPASLLELLPTVLAQVPDPDGALNYLERFTRELPQRVTDGIGRQPVLLHSLLALFSSSRFLSETLILEPELILWLGREKLLERMPSKEELLEEYARFETAAFDLEPSLALARFKRRQYLRIVLKDILGLSPLVETTMELSTLADVLLEKALRRADSELRRRYGAPETLDARERRVPARFAVVSLGKLGGNELNYSSDIDLLFLFDGSGETAGPEWLANSEYFIRLAQRLLQIITGVSSEGVVFRVDMRLRPGGGEGDLAISLPAAIDYYARRAREWELQMLLKARHSAGDAALVREFQSAVEPFLYRGAMHFPAVEAVLKAREDFARKVEAAGGTNVKLAPGGLRDIEFLVQCLQRLHGRDDPWVRAAGTLVGLHKLFDKGYLAARDHSRLAAAYQFLRLVEHRLQLEQGQQSHTVPKHAEALDLLSRRCGVATLPDFERILEGHLRHVRAIYERRLPRGTPAAEAPEFSLRAPGLLAMPETLSYAELLEWLRAQASPLYFELEKLDVPPRAHRLLHRFLTATVQSSAGFEEVNRAAAALPSAVELFRLSEPLAALLVRHPEWLARLTEANQADRGASGQLGMLLVEAGSSEVSPRLAAILERRRPLSWQMGSLRAYFAEAVFGWGAGELCPGAHVEAGLDTYTVLTEEILRAGWRIAAQEDPGAGDPAAVLALGRLGTREMDLGSDADLVFVAADAEAQQRLRPVAERFLHVVSGYTSEGTLFPVDVRLRPRGGEGELVQTVDGLLDYFRNSAAVWEAATYLKLRPIALNSTLGEQVRARLLQALSERFSEWERVRTELRTMRQRLEEEGGKENLKTIPGGFYDIDYILSALALRAGAACRAGRAWTEQIENLSSAELGAEERQTLREAVRLFRAVDHAIRLATGKNAPQLPSGAKLDIVAELTGRWLSEPLSGAVLATRLSDARRSVRSVFERVFG